MKPFTESSHCRSRAHCATCRSDEAWRALLGAPSECPHGVTGKQFQIMNIIRDTSTPPEHGWWYPGLNGYTISTYNFSLFFDLVKEHFTTNGAPAPSDQDIIDHICATASAPCYDSETRVPLINRLTALPPPSKGCCGKK